MLITVNQTYVNIYSVKPLAIYYLKMAYISSSGEFPLIIVITTLAHIYHSRVTFELAKASSGFGLRLHLASLKQPDS